MANVVKDLGAVSAYALAVKHGYKGTEEEWVAAQEAARVAAETAAENAEQTLARVGEQSNIAIEAVKGQETLSIDAVEAAGANQVDTVEAKGVEVLNSIPADYTEMVADAKMHAPCIACDVNGGMVTVTDAAERGALGVVSAIATVQSGTGDPSPDNVRPISGWDTVGLSRTRKNMLGFEDFSLTSTGVYTDTYTDGVFRREVSQYVTTTFAVSKTAMTYLKHNHIPAGTYTFTATYTGNTTYKGLYLEVTLSDGTIAQLPNGETTTITQGGTITGVRMTSQSLLSGTTIECTMQLEAGTGTSYEPYSGATMTAALPETIYGGSLNWTTGELTVMYVAQSLTGNEAWAAGGSGLVYTLDNRTVQNKSLTDNNIPYHLCSHYKPVAYKSPADQADMTCYTLNSYQLNIKNTTAGTLANFKAYLSAQAAAGTPVTLLWPLKPAYYSTIQLTPQQLDMLKGYNTIWSDSGDTSLVYVADTKMYIDNKFTALQNAILAQGANI